MRVTVIGKNINVTPALKEIVEKKISKMDKYFEPNVTARATLTENKLERQIRKQKTKLQRRSNESLRFGNFDEVASEEDDNEGEIVKVKRFNIKPMSAEEAILQMELVEHNFFVFKDCDTENINVIYKRKDGNYGLIEPEYK